MMREAAGDLHSAGRFIPLAYIISSCNLNDWGISRFPRVKLSQEGGTGMPTYSYVCKKCGKQFLEILSFREYEEGKRKCPKCGSANVVQVLEGFYAKTSKKS